ncbi:MAG TPA: formate--tetrahydrofolate ligase [Halanaerobiales bacterium]|nr:formate--tetrahydrofolate ligase [Halanaerobiales bacterium]
MSIYTVKNSEEFSIKEKIDKIAKVIYGADGVDYSSAAEKQISTFEKQVMVIYRSVWPRPKTPYLISQRLREDRLTLRSQSPR